MRHLPTFTIPRLRQLRFTRPATTTIRRRRTIPSLKRRHRARLCHQCNSDIGCDLMQHRRRQCRGPFLRHGTQTLPILGQVAFCHARRTKIPKGKGHLRRSRIITTESQSCPVQVGTVHKTRQIRTNRTLQSSIGSQRVHTDLWPRLHLYLHPGRALGLNSNNPMYHCRPKP